MSDNDREALVEIRGILTTLHDQRIGWRERQIPLSVTEMAALRDSARRLTDIIGRNAPAAAEPRS